MTILRTNSEHLDFVKLVNHLDAYLAKMDGDEHAFYHQFNKIDKLKFVVVAYEDSVPVGCGAIKILTEDAMEVKRMYVVPQYRGKGVASSLLASLEAWTWELGYQRCMLETGKRQIEAVALYKKQGYVIVPNYGQYAGIENSLCFEKRLN
jgi:GNAT superfamily N-acetyltransferase